MDGLVRDRTRMLDATERLTTRYVFATYTHVVVLCIFIPRSPMSLDDACMQAKQWKIRFSFWALERSSVSYRPSVLAAVDECFDFDALTSRAVNLPCLVR